MTTNEVIDPSIQAILDYASGINPSLQLNPADLLPGGKYQMPAGFLVTVDTFNERVSLFAPHDAPGVWIKTLNPWGGEFKIQGLDLLRALTQALRVGDPTGWRSSPDEKHQYFMGLVATALPFIVPDKEPMTRAQMQRFIETNANCQRVSEAFCESVNGTGALVKDAQLRELIEKATADPEAAIAHYNRIRDSRRGITRPLDSHKATRPAATQEA